MRASRDEGPESREPAIRPRREFRFEKLGVWQAARKFNAAVSKLTKGFPASEQYVLTSQLRRSALSVMSNIAEGAGRNSDRDFAHFLEQAYGSLMETACQLFVAFDEGYLNQERLNGLLAEADAIAGQLVCLNRSLGVEGSKVRPRVLQ